MTIAALMPVRNEGWILGFSARAVLRWADLLVISLHACEDDSPDIVKEISAEYPGRVYAFRNSQRDWNEMEQRNKLLNQARAMGATHMAITDADEVLTANLTANIRPAIERLTPGYIMDLPGYNLRGGLERYHANGTWGQRWFSFAFRDSRDLHWSGDRFHHRDPMGRSFVRVRQLPQGQGGILHFWGADENRLRAKHSLYKLTERLKWPEKSIGAIDLQYSLAIHGKPGTPDTPKFWKYESVPSEWISGYGEILQHVDLRRKPWQIEEVRRIYASDPANFKGLDLFGLV